MNACPHTPRANLVRYLEILAARAGCQDVLVRGRNKVSLAAPPSPSCPCKPSPAPGRMPARPGVTEDGVANGPIGRPTPPSSKQGAREASGTAPCGLRRNRGALSRHHRVAWQSRDLPRRASILQKKKVSTI